MAAVPHILVVEDESGTAEMLTSYFEAQGFRVSSVAWGNEALTFVKHTVPDLIILDIRLPDIDGYEVCRQLRASRRTEHVPVMFLTEKQARADKLTGLELGAVDYVTKPFDLQELRLRVRNILRRSSTDQLIHPITGLPTASLADERLRALLARSDWAVLSVGLQGLKKFSQVYGFVTRDDVLRAVALMLNHVVSEARDPDACVGHLDDSSFFIIVAPDKIKQVQEALAVRLDEAMAFFYPCTDWEAGQADPDADVPHIGVAMGVLRPAACSFSGLEDLRKALIEVRRAG